MTTPETAHETTDLQRGVQWTRVLVVLAVLLVLTLVIRWADRWIDEFWYVPFLVVVVLALSRLQQRLLPTSFATAMVGVGLFVAGILVYGVLLSGDNLGTIPGSWVGTGEGRSAVDLT